LISLIFFLAKHPLGVHQQNHGCKGHSAHVRTEDKQVVGNKNTREARKQWEGEKETVAADKELGRRTTFIPVPVGGRCHGPTCYFFFGLGFEDTFAILSKFTFGLY
jgi:hypothetical protein